MIHAVLICQSCFRTRFRCLLNTENLSQHIGYSKADQVLHAAPSVSADGHSKDIFPHFDPSSRLVQLSGCT